MKNLQLQQSDIQTRMYSIKYISENLYFIHAISRINTDVSDTVNYFAGRRRRHFLQRGNARCALLKVHYILFISSAFMGK